VPRDFPASAISSDNNFIFDMYSDAIIAPFFVVAKAIRVLTTLARVCEEKISSTAA
jgi:hypothetical protein